MKILERHRVILTLKIAASAVSLFVLADSINVSYIGNSINNIDFKFVALGAVIFWIAQLASSMRCIYIARELSKELSLFQAIRAHFIGLWFNQVLPTSLGGDVVKVVILRKTLGDAVAIKAAILDRLSGLFVLMLAVLFTLPWYSRILPIENQTLIQSLKVVSVGFIVSIFTTAWISSKLQMTTNHSLVKKELIELCSDMWRFRRGVALWNQIWTGAIIHISGFTTYALLGLAFGYTEEPITYVLLVPLVFLVAVIPISFAGWGLREAGAVWLFGLVGMPAQNALLLSVSYGLMLIITAIPGLFWFIWNRRVN